ncbi:UNC5C-like protein isoform X1 [Pteropus medius]|uniref:UNC5C-like protein n=2 Tax=Pteropus vampyrus TaxID=132908 RepID=A0A6P3PWG7_PTEVA|nr:UNC5C-like protein [Pteropus vampyrus]XP_039710482.1 UNC5C-like protein isoform X1 [Pteropus giganteus]XP_039710483.1 UNC5C-like protein isoform X1 [Pteropus giganteus]XP_039710484.1 UNC5C-like protein isoform X1 [Pteropus giganteus]
MCSHESSFQLAQFLLLVGVPVASVLLLVQCLRWHCPRWLPRGRWKLDSQEEPVSDPSPLPENESPRQCLPATLPEMVAFYQELHTPTQGQTIVRQLMHKLLVFSAREVDHRGGCLILQDMGISLLIPPGAVAVGRQERVSLILVWDLSDAPSLSKAQALVSPVVACGPHGASFLKPCTLTFKHCAQQSSHACAYSSNTNLLDVKAWKPLGQSGGHTSLDECRIHLSHFSLYTCVLEAPVGHEARKWLQLAVFCSPLAPGQSHLQLRVYFLNNTPCALQWALTNEQPHGGRLRGPCQLFDFTGARGDQCLKLKYISEGWENVDDSSCQLVPHLHIWHGKCPFRSFCFRRKAANENEDCSALTNEIIVTMHTFQDGLETKYMEILRFQASEEEAWAAPPPVSQPPPCNRLPPELFEQLQMLLEPSSITGNDWRRLASHLGLCGMKIRFLSCQRSPAAAILELFEEQNGSLQELHYLMTLMERLDCASVIQNYLSGSHGGSPGPVVRGGSWENQGLELELELDEKL